MILLAKLWLWKDKKGNFMTLISSQHLIETEWLEEHLDDSDLRILDCTVSLDAESGRDTWTRGHIPGSGFVDLIQDLSDQNSSLPFMMPTATQFVEAVS